MWGFEEMRNFKVIFIAIAIFSQFVFADSFFENLSNQSRSKKIRLLEGRIKFICSSGSNLQISETLKVYLSLINQNADNFEILEKCLNAKDDHIKFSFAFQILKSAQKEVVWKLFESLEKLNDPPFQDSFRNYVMIHLEGDDFKFIESHRGKLSKIFERKLAELNSDKYYAVKKVVFLAFESLSKSFFESPGYKKIEDNKSIGFWNCVYLKNIGKYDRSRACFNRNSLGISRSFSLLTSFLETRKPLVFSQVKPDIDQGRKSNLPIEVKMVNEAILLSVLQSSEEVDKNILIKFVESDSKDQWYNFIAYLMGKKFELLNESHLERLRERLLMTSGGRDLKSLVDEENSIPSEIFSANTYQGILLRMSGASI
ncbi:MAG: hypothetical protein CL676_00175 [Bdellovibrionaceae bacterium]|nr:hypothetical protein [Pseudobdellovibrionaceae bacterium]|tara:strand:- start:5258 stop:6370 length:1113 start_codon:yes stop_codon:yes gene_type:complete